MSTHNICFYGELTKIILQLSSKPSLLFFYHFDLLHRKFHSKTITVQNKNITWMIHKKYHIYSNKCPGGAAIQKS